MDLRWPARTRWERRHSNGIAQLRYIVGGWELVLAAIMVKYHRGGLLLPVALLLAAGATFYVCVPDPAHGQGAVRA